MKRRTRLAKIFSRKKTTTKNPAGIGALSFEFRQIKLMAEVGERHGCVCTRARVLLQLL